MNESGRHQSASKAAVSIYLALLFALFLSMPANSHAQSKSLARWKFPHRGSLAIRRSCTTRD